MFLISTCVYTYDFTYLCYLLINELLIVISCIFRGKWYPNSSNYTCIPHFIDVVLILFILGALLLMKVQWLFDDNFISWSEYVVMSLDIDFPGIMHSMGFYFGQTLYII